MNFLTDQKMTNLESEGFQRIVMEAIVGSVSETVK